MLLRGFTLLELLIAIALVVALSALALPAVTGQLSGAQDRASVSALQSLLAMTRTDAMRTGQPIRVLVRTSGNGVVRLYSERLDLQSSAAPLEPLSEVSDPDAFAFGFDDAPVRRLLLELSRGHRIVTEAPLPPDDMSGMPADMSGFIDDEEWPGDEFVPGDESGFEWLSLLVLMPDGSALMPSPRYLVVSSTRAYEFVVNRWTGSCRLQVVRASDDDMSEDEGEDDLPSDLRDAVGNESNRPEGSGDDRRRRP